MKLPFNVSSKAAIFPKRRKLLINHVLNERRVVTQLSQASLEYSDVLIYMKNYKQFDQKRVIKPNPKKNKLKNLHYNVNKKRRIKVMKLMKVRKIYISNTRTRSTGPKHNNTNFK